MNFPPLSGHLPLYAVVVVVFLVMISVLVFAHEAGHYLFARLFNMGVEEFAIGFGKNPRSYASRKYVLHLKPGESPHGQLPAAAAGTAIGDQTLSAPGGLSKVAQYMGSMEGGDKPQREDADEHALERPDTQYSSLVEGPNGPELHETTYFTVRPIPAGGFVRIKGMFPEEDGSETKIAGGFYSKPPWQRLIVLLAGPAFSVLAGILILVPVYMIEGSPRADQKPVLGQVNPGTPAERAKLKKGDLILAIDGAPVTRFSDILKRVTTSNGRTLTFEYSRDGKDYTTSVTPALDNDPTAVLDSDLEPTPGMARQWHIGTIINSKIIRPSVGMALSEACEAPVVTVVGIFEILQKPSSFKDNVGGPGRMVAITADAVQDGVLQVFKLMALLSISVGIFNLLPFPPLDGGQMVIAFAELLRGGRRLSMQIQGMVSALGLLAVCSLIFSALYFDFQQLTKHTPKSSPVAAPAVAAPAKSPAKTGKP